MTDTGASFRQCVQPTPRTALRSPAQVNQEVTRGLFKCFFCRFRQTAPLPFGAAISSLARRLRSRRSLRTRSAAAMLSVARRPCLSPHRAIFAQLQAFNITNLPYRTTPARSNNDPRYFSISSSRIVSKTERKVNRYWIKRHRQPRYYVLAPPRTCKIKRTDGKSEGVSRIGPRLYDQRTPMLSTFCRVGENSRPSKTVRCHIRYQKSSIFRDGYGPVIQASLFGSHKKFK